VSETAGVGTTENIANENQWNLVSSRHSTWHTDTEIGYGICTLVAVRESRSNNRSVTLGRTW